MQRSAKKTKPVLKRAASFSEEETESDVNNKVQEVKPKEPITFQKVFVRSAAATAMSLIYLGLLQTGHLYCIMTVMLVQVKLLRGPNSVHLVVNLPSFFFLLFQTQLYKEIVNVRYVEAKERAMPLFRSLQWAWFFLSMIFVCKCAYCRVCSPLFLIGFLLFWDLDGDALHRFCQEHKSLNHMVAITQNLDYFVYGLYWSTFVASVLTLKPGMIRFQLSQHMWSIVTVCIVVFQSKFFATNTLNGLFWFFFPFATVIMNDVSAYFCGISFGRKFITTPFLALSPNKTWEGFIGAGVCTIVFSFFFPALLAQYTWFTCPADGLYIWPFPPALTCTPNAVFIKTLIDVPYVGPTMLYPIQLHGLGFGLFASLVAPFGGFFAR
jgi:phosphatidate cytidylyltransferase